MEKYACMGAKLLQLCLTLWHPMDCSPPGSSLHGIIQSRILVGFQDLLQGILLNQESNLCLLHLLHCRQILYHQATKEAQRIVQRFFKKLKIELP